jgi:hypothetical protein
MIQLIHETKERPYGTAFWLLDRASGWRAQNVQELPANKMELPVRLRHRARCGVFVACEWEVGFVWLYQINTDQPTSHKTWNGTHPTICGLAWYAAKMQQPETQRVFSLRWARHRRLRQMARFLCVLAGYGAIVCARLDVGPHRRERQLRTGELSMGNLQRAGVQPSPAWAFA